MARKPETFAESINVAITETPAESLRDVLLCLGEAGTDVLVVNPLLSERDKVTTAISNAGYRRLALKIDSFASAAIIDAADVGVRLGVALGLNARQYIAELSTFSETLVAAIAAAGLADYEIGTRFEYGEGQSDGE